MNLNFKLSPRNKGTPILDNNFTASMGTPYLPYLAVLMGFTQLALPWSTTIVVEASELAL